MIETVADRTQELKNSQLDTTEFLLFEQVSNFFALLHHASGQILATLRWTSPLFLQGRDYGSNVDIGTGIGR